MALTTIQSNNKATKFRNRFIREFVRGDMFKAYKSEDGNAVIRVFMDTGKFGGEQSNLPLVNALSGTGVGSGKLTGSEEAIGNYGWRAWIDWLRNAVTANDAEIKKGSFDLFGHASAALSEWGKKMQRDETVVGFMAIPSEAPPANLGSAPGQRVNGILWSAATAANKNTWQDNNADRILFGAARTNLVAGNFASSLLNVDASADRLSAASIGIMKWMAERASPAIEPLTTDDGYERYVMFVGSNAYRDAYRDPEIYAANKDARPREGSRYKNNPIFMDGDLLYNGVIIRKVPQIDTLVTNAGAGAAGINVAPVFMCGKNALAWIWGQMPSATSLDETDYQFIKGVGIQMCYGVGKIASRPPGQTYLKDWGVVTGFVASVDS